MELEPCCVWVDYAADLAVTLVRAFESPGKYFLHILSN